MSLDTNWEKMGKRFMRILKDLITKTCQLKQSKPFQEDNKKRKKWV